MTFINYFAAACNPNATFLGLPTWYKYLKTTDDKLGNCAFNVNLLGGDFWLIAAAIIEILLRIAALVAIGFVITGGVKFISAQGEPDKVAAARKTTINALIGLAISISATGLVSFIARKF